MAAESERSQAKGNIKEVFIFVTNIGSAKYFADQGVKVTHLAPKELVPRADQELGFDGALIAYCNTKSPCLVQKDVSKMTDEQWASFITADIAHGRQWYRWYGESPTAIYTVVVITESSP